MMIYLVLLGLLFFWLVDRNGLCSGLGKKNRLIEGKGWSSTLCYPASLSQQKSQCLSKDALQIIQHKSAFYISWIHSFI